MIHGRVNESGCALVSLSLRSSADSRITTADAWIDTGFTSELALPRALIRQWALPVGGLVRVLLADGTETKSRTHLMHLN